MSKNCFIYETLNPIKELAAERKGDLMTLSGVFGVCGVKNNNQRIYETANYSKMVSEMQQRIKTEGGVPGELEHPQTMNITLENISHKIDEINIDENGVVTGTITLLNTPKGKIAQAIVEGGLPLFISSRAKGNVAKDGKVTLEELKTYDLVGSPGFSQAKLKLNENQIAESICESVYYITEKENIEEENNNIEENNNNIEENNNIDDMDLKEILEKLEDMENRIEELESEKKELNEKLGAMADSVQKWIVEEYSPEVQEWITEHFGESLKEEILEEHEEFDATALKNEIYEKVADTVQKWIIESYSPEVQTWVLEHFAPEVQRWIVEEYSQGVENWISEELKPEIENQISESIKESKKTSLDSIDETIKLLENIQQEKPVHSRVTRQLNEDVNEPKYIAEMPEEIRPMWNMASQEVKESIKRKAKLYDLVSEGAIEKFWNSINFEEVKPTKNIYEGLQEVENEWERNIRMKIRAARAYRGQ